MRKISDGAEIHLESLTIPELDRLHYEEECFAAEKARKLPAFSAQRDRLLAEGYALVHEIMQRKSALAGHARESFGAEARFIGMMQKIIARQRRRLGRENIAFFEAGVGTGMILRGLAGDPGICLRGCDYCVSGELASDPRFAIDEGSLLESLHKTEDGSLDIFYSNDVMEHLLEDEVDGYLEIIRRKLAPDGLVVTITPHRLLGPHDVTSLFHPPGTKAKGFHFHEYTHGEFCQRMRANGFRTAMCVTVSPFSKDYRIVASSRFGNAAVGAMRFCLETVARVLPRSVRERVLRLAGCNVTVMCKTDI